MNYKLCATLLITTAFYVNTFTLESTSSQSSGNNSVWRHPATLIVLGSAAILGFGCLIYYLSKSNRKNQMQQFCSPISFQEERIIAQKMQVNDQSFVQQLAERIASYGIQHPNGFPNVSYESMLAKTYDQSLSLLTEFDGTNLQPLQQGSIQYCRSLATDLNRIRVHIRSQPTYQTELRDYQRAQTVNQQLTEIRRHNHALEDELKRLNATVQQMQGSLASRTNP